MREKEYLKRQYSAIFRSIGLILVFAGLLMCLPLICMVWQPINMTIGFSFLAPSLVMITIGIFFRLVHAHEHTSLSLRDGGVIVVVSWLLVIFFSAWPFALLMGIPFSHAFFESMSGWTTTGLSVLEIGAIPPILFFWRSVIQLVGGAGLAIVMLSAITGPSGIGISSAEGRGDQLVPNVKKSARLVLLIYSAYAGFGVLAYRWAGMTWFDAINHSFACVSTGGFSTQGLSIGAWDSVRVEMVTIPLMLLGNLSFVSAWLLWRGKTRVFLKMAGVRLQAFVLPLAICFSLLFCCLSRYPTFQKAFRVAVFECTSALTTTGFSTVSYSDWSPFGIGLLILLMLIGGGACSTAGGIKQFRVYLMYKFFSWELIKLLKPSNQIVENAIWEGQGISYIDNSKINQIASFIFLYLCTYAVGVLVFCASGFSLSDSLFEFASALGTVGLSVGITGPAMPPLALWSEILAMFLGRLEFIVIIVSIIKISKDLKALMHREQQAYR